MLPLIDFRNGRYQGGLRNGLPDGPGIFFSTELLFVFGHWLEGVLQGNTIFIYHDATVFCGNLHEGKPQGLCYFELQRENVKVYFYRDESKQDGGKNDVFAISVPNFSSVLEVDATSLEIKGESKVRRGDNIAVMEEVSRVLGKKVESEGREYEGFIQYFEQHFARPYSDIFQQLIINVNGAVQFSMSFRLEGLGIKVRPLPLEESGGRSYRISQMGVMTRENVLFGVGVKNSNSVLGRVQVEEGVYALPHTLVSYRLSEGPADKTRPVKCLSTFLSFLKRSLDFRDSFLSIKQATTFKETINKIHESTFTEMKVKNAHEIIENPVKDEAVRLQIERNRRKRQEESELFQKSKRNAIQSTVYNSGASLLVNPNVNLTSMREDLQRSITKRQLSKSKISPTNNDTKQYDSPSILPSTNSPVKNRSPDRANGSITPPKNRKTSYDRKKTGLLTGKQREESLRASPNKYPPDLDPVKEEVKPPVPAPILKQVVTDSPNKRKVNYRQKQLEEWEKSQLKFTRTNSPKKYGKESPVKNNRQVRSPVKANSPVKNYSRPLLTENIFQ